MPNPILPHYDEAGVTYDGGFFYADGVPDIPSPNPKHRMASLKQNLTRKNPTQLIELADLVTPKLAPAAPATPPIPNMAAKVAALIAKRNAAHTANQAYESAKAALVNLKEARDATADDLRTEHGSVGKAIEAEAKGDPVMLSASGYDMSEPSTPATTPPAQIKNLSLTAGDADGSLDVGWDSDPLARTYEVQCTTENPITGPWATVAQPTASSCNITHEASGIRCWVRVRAIGAKGPGPWSDPATKIVP
jgi:hypothetical protein